MTNIGRSAGRLLPTPDCTTINWVLKLIAILVSPSINRHVWLRRHPATVLVSSTSYKLASKTQNEPYFIAIKLNSEWNVLRCKCTNGVAALDVWHAIMDRNGRGIGSFVYCYAMSPSYILVGSEFGKWSAVYSTPYSTTSVVSCVCVR